MAIFEWLLGWIIVVSGSVAVIALSLAALIYLFALWRAARGAASGKEGT